MLAGISLTCFTASYAVALALEAARMWFRSNLRGAVVLAFALAGLAAHTLFLAHRAMTTAGTPLSSEFDWYLIAGWSLAAVYLMWTLGQFRAPAERRTALGLFVLPVILGLVAAAHFFASRDALPLERALGIWVVIHLVLLVTGLVSVLIGFVAGLMELMQAHRLKSKFSPRSALKLPSLEWLERTSLRTLYTSFVLFGLGLITGLFLNYIAGQFSWGDIAVWRLMAVFVWQTAVVMFVSFYRPARQGRKVAYLAVASAIVVLISLGLGLALPSNHGAPMRSTQTETQTDAPYISLSPGLSVFLSRLPSRPSSRSVTFRSSLDSGAHA